MCNIKPHPWRSLKTASSERIIPLVGSAKWAADQILAHPAMEVSLLSLTTMMVKELMLIQQVLP